MSNRYLLVSGCLVLTALSCGAQGNRTIEPVPVMVEVLTLQSISRTVYAPCRLEAGFEAVVSIPVPGVVEEVLVETGDTVTAGERLLVLRTDDMRRASVSSAAALVEASRASREYAGCNLDRAEELFNEGAMSLQEYQTMETEAQAAEAGYAQAVAGYEAAVSSAGTGSVTAPFSGTVGRIIATQGNPASGPLLSIFSGGVFKAELLVAPRHLPLLSEGIPAVFITDHFPGEFFSGCVISVSKDADPVSGLVPVSVQFSDTADLLVPGLSGLTMLSLETMDSVVVLGENALTPLGECCWEAARVEDGKVQMVQVTTGIQNGNRHQIVSGLTPGDSVITLGHTIVSEGEYVRVVSR